MEEQRHEEKEMKKKSNKSKHQKGRAATFSKSRGGLQEQPCTTPSDEEM
jgi:hypothetical protein